MTSVHPLILYTLDVSSMKRFNLKLGKIVGQVGHFYSPVSVYMCKLGNGEEGRIEKCVLSGGKEFNSYVIIQISTNPEKICFLYSTTQHNNTLFSVQLSRR